MLQQLHLFAVKLTAGSPLPKCSRVFALLLAASALVGAGCSSKTSSPPGASAIGPTGGTAEIAQASVIVPAGSLTTTTSISVSVSAAPAPTSPASFDADSQGAIGSGTIVAASPVIELGPAGTTFSTPVRVNIKPDLSALPPEAVAALKAVDGGLTMPAPVVGPNGEQISVADALTPTQHTLTQFRVVTAESASGPWTALPLIYENGKFSFLTTHFSFWSVVFGANWTSCNVCSSRTTQWMQHWLPGYPGVVTWSDCQTSFGLGSKQYVHVDLACGCGKQGTFVPASNAIGKVTKATACGGNGSCTVTTAALLTPVCSCDSGLGGPTCNQVTVTASSGDGFETFTPNTPVVVQVGQSTQITVTANTGYTLSPTPMGTCPAGSWAANVYTTGLVTANCTVVFSATAINTCSTANGGCDANATCAMTGPGKNSCACKQGYTGTGQAGNCASANSCATNNGGCGSNAMCMMTGPGTNSCSCNQGYALDAPTPVANTVSDTTVEYTTVNSTNTYWGQTFTTGPSGGTLSGLTVTLAWTPAPVFNGSLGEIYAHFYQGTPGNTMTELGAAANLSYALGPVNTQTGQQNVLTFPTPITLLANTQYTFIFHTTGGQYFSIFADDQNPYAGGTLLTCGGASSCRQNPAAYTAVSGSDLWFQLNFTGTGTPAQCVP
jgi:hypothetical protein